MAIVNIKSSAVTNADNPLQAYTSTKVAGGRIKERVGTVETGAADSIDSVYRFCRIKSGDRVSRLLLSCDAIATAPAADFGIHETAANGGAIVDRDFFASAQLLSAALSHVDITHEADPADAGVGYGQQDVEKPLWQALGLAADPNKDYDVTGMLTVATTAIGTISVKVQYIDGN